MKGVLLCPLLSVIAGWPTFSHATPAAGSVSVPSADLPDHEYRDWLKFGTEMRELIVQKRVEVHENEENFQKTVKLSEILINMHSPDAESMKLMAELAGELKEVIGGGESISIFVQGLLENYGKLAGEARVICERDGGPCDSEIYGFDAKACSPFWPTGLNCQVVVEGLLLNLELDKILRSYRDILPKLNSKIAFECDRRDRIAKEDAKLPRWRLFLRGFAQSFADELFP